MIFREVFLAEAKAEGGEGRARNLLQGWKVDIVG
jgi:hypothetical protein